LNLVRANFLTFWFIYFTIFWSRTSNTSSSICTNRCRTGNITSSWICVFIALIAFIIFAYSYKINILFCYIFFQPMNCHNHPNLCTERKILPSCSLSIFANYYTVFLRFHISSLNPSRYRLGDNYLVMS
jgi:hypothetical protein